MEIRSTAVAGSISGAGGLVALRSGRKGLALFLFSASAGFFFTASRLALDLRREVVLTVAHWVLAHLPESSRSHVS